MTVPYYAYNEAVAVRDRGKAISETLVEAFQKLVRTLARMAPNASSLKDSFGSDYAYDASFATAFLYDVFVSYSQANSEWVWAWLVPRLKKAGLQVCLDRDVFDIGVPDVINLENAIIASRYTLLVLTPEWVAQGWNGFEALFVQLADPANFLTRTLPVLLKPCDIPPRIAMLTYADFTNEMNNETELSRLIDAIRNMRRLPDISSSLNVSFKQNQILTESDTQLPVSSSLQRTIFDYYQHIPLPPNYVARPELMYSIHNMLLNDSSRDNFVDRNKPIALHGMGGIGKSVIARALCDDSDVRVAFPDGILWATLGQTPEITSIMRSWVNMLGGSINENLPTVNSLKVTLSELLKDRSCLLILDDVWHRSSVDAFRIDGPHCRLLLTTRDAEIAYALGAKVLSIPVMTSSQALSLLEEWTDGYSASIDISLKRQIVERLGYLPLAVKLAGAQLRRKSPQDWLATFDIRKLKSPRPESIHDSLELTFQLSLAALDVEILNLYVTLAIFQEDEAIPQVGIERLWQKLGALDSSDTRDLLNDLEARALLEITSTPLGAAEIQANYYRSNSSEVVKPVDKVVSIERWVLLHDLLRDSMKIKIGDQFIPTHIALLDVYGATRIGKGWHTAPDDGYLYDHLAYHLHSVGSINELKELFVDQKWLHVRVPQSNYTYDGYLNDINLAWDATNAETKVQIDSDLTPTTFANCIRFALICTSINSIGSNYIPELVMQAIELGLWTSNKAISIAVKISDVRQRAKMYASLLRSGKLSERQQIQVQQLWMEIALSADEDSATLVELAPFLQGKLLEQGLEAAMDMNNEKRRVEFLVALAPKLTGKLLEQVLEVTLSVSDSSERVKALAALVPHLTGNLKAQVLQNALEVTLTLNNEEVQARTLTELVPHLAGEQRFQTAQHSLDIALSLTDMKARAQILATLAPSLTNEMLQRTLETALAIDDEEECIRALTVLAHQIADEQRLQIVQSSLEIALSLRDQNALARALVTLAPFLTGMLQERGLETAFALIDEYQRTRVLAAFLPFIPNQASLLRSIRHMLTTHLLALKEKYREDVLNFCADKVLFTSPILSPETLGRIAANIIEICQEWKWI